MDDFEIDLGGRGRPRPRLQAALRIGFGLLGLGLSLVGIGHLLGPQSPLPVLAWQLAGALLFLALGCFCLFNVVLLRPWRWPGRLTLLALPLLFLVRLLIPA